MIKVPDCELPELNIDDVFVNNDRKNSKRKYQQATVNLPVINSRIQGLSPYKTID